MKKKCLLTGCRVFIPRRIITGYQYGKQCNAWMVTETVLEISENANTDYYK